VLDEAYQPFSSRAGCRGSARCRTSSSCAPSASSAWPACASATSAGPAALVDEIDKVRPPYNIGALNAEATLFALEHADEFARQAATIRAERERLQAPLAALPASSPSRARPT
jgi:histidinol-phosphate aminotransferase